MPWYKIDVDGQVFVAEYGAIEDAIFGTLRKEVCRFDRDSVMVGAEKLPPCPRGMAKATYTRQLRKEHEANTGNPAADPRVRY